VGSEGMKRLVGYVLVIPGTISAFSRSAEGRGTYIPPEVMEAEYQNIITLPAIIAVVIVVAAGLCYWFPRFRPLWLGVATLLISTVVWFGGQGLLQWYPELLLLIACFGGVALVGAVRWFKNARE
jgi:lipopolysaccharide export LptBFGC system permease protein LptF